MKKTFVAALVAASLAVPAWAQSNCGSVADVTAKLTLSYGEEVAAEGVDTRGQLVQMWGNPQTGSWTATVSNGDMMCIVAQGGGFARVAFRPNL